MKIFRVEHSFLMGMLNRFRCTAGIQSRYIVLMFIACFVLPQVSLAVSPFLLPIKSDKSEPTSQEETYSPAPANSEETEDVIEEDGNEDVRLQAGDTLYLNLEAVDVEDPITSFDESKIYILNYRGELTLPLVGNVPLAGLSEAEAVVRLQAEPLLQGYNIVLKALPVEPIGSDALELFGMSFFEDLPPVYTDTANIPVPENYIVGPGDTVVVQLYGKENVTHELVVSRDGVINFPDIGPVTVSGQTFEDVASNLKARISEQLIGVKAYVTLGELRSINVLLAGEVAQPGEYVISAMSTVTNVLYSSGGVSAKGSLRNIQVRRGGNVITRIDLYDLLLRGNNKNDIRLQSGDVIFVPPLGKTVGVSGEVQRPAIYELKQEKTVGELLSLAGGPTSTAYIQQTQIERIDNNGKRVVRDLDLTSDSGKQFGIQNGDIISIARVLDQKENWVGLIGHVKRPAKYQWVEGMRLTDLLPSPDELKPKPDLDYVVIRRENKLSHVVTVFSVSLRSAFVDKTSQSNVTLQPNDQVYVFGFESDSERKLKIEKLIDELELQANDQMPAMWVNVTGSVRAEGTYPLEPGMTISKLILAGGGLTEDAYPIWAELTRYNSSTEKRHAEHIQINLAGITKGDATADILLQPRDSLVIKRMPEWVDEMTVEIQGEVRFPGVYPITRGESLSSVLVRAGGLNELAATDASIFIRESLKEKEGIRLKKLADRLEMELKSTLLEKINKTQRPEEGLTIANEMLVQLRTMEPVGRLVINLPGLLADMSEDHASDYDVLLENGDMLIIPEFNQEVSVVGEVFVATSHLFNPEWDVEDYIDVSGGYTRKADTSNTYVFHADGSASPDSSNNRNTTRLTGPPGQRSRIAWNGGSDSSLRPGDTIVVPLNAEKVPTLDLWSEVSQIIFNIGITAAAIDNLLN